MEDDDAGVALPRQKTGTTQTRDETLQQNASLP